MAETWKTIAFVEDVVTNASFDAQSVLAATVDDTPVALVIAEQELLGRVTGGDIDGIAIGIANDNILQVDSADAATGEYAKFTDAGLESKSVSEVLSDLSVTSGADVTGDNAPQAHAASHKNAGTDEILLNEFGEPTGAVDFNGQQLQNTVIHTVADNAAKTALTAVAGMICYQTDETAIMVCTEGEA